MSCTPYLHAMLQKSLHFSFLYLYTFHLRHLTLLVTHRLLAFDKSVFPSQAKIHHVYVMISPTSTICGFQLFLALPFSVTSMSLGRTMSSGVGE